jgi:class 3 adenylate cyclase/tetratricopeptide (TPR) repeat protein
MMQQPPMPSVRSWLESVGLVQYAELFEAQAIDFELLTELTEEDLQKLGIAVLGHRLRLMKAIATLSGRPSARQEAVANGDHTRIGVPTAPERRQLTVMFCDLVGSTALSRRLDPEDLRALMQEYQEVCRQVVERYQGHVAQYLGDGLMCYFGWPRAHEDDAQRAVRAALEIVDEIKRIQAAEPLHVRIGIGTGPVVIGETGWGDAAVPRTAVGETPNVAARVQTLAGPDQVVIAASTQRLTAGSFEYEDLGEHSLSGIGEPLRVWRVVGVSRAQDRFAAAHGPVLTQLIGRETEITMLRNKWSQAREGEGQAVLLYGQPGMGKSRITQELCERVAKEPHWLLRYQCSQYYSNSAFYCVLATLQRTSGFERTDSTATKLVKLEAALAPVGELRDRLAPLYAALMSLPLDGFPPFAGSPQKQKQETMEAMVESVIVLARSKPVLMVFEDLHWVDPSTLEVINLTVDRTRESRVLLLMTSRPEFASPWVGHAHVTAHSLNRLSRRHSVALVTDLSKDYGLPEQMINDIVAKTDGVPLFLEEVTKNVLHSDRQEKQAGGIASARLEIPVTLRDSLTARLDELSAAKKMAQIGAVIGRQFRYDLMRDMAEMPDEELAAALDALVESGLVWQRGERPNSTYTFKHALIQDAAYESLLKSDRKMFHRRAAEALVQHFPEMSDSEPEVIARHYSAGDVPEKAAQLWLKAGQKAWQRSTATEAIAHLTSGLEAVKRIGDMQSREALELRLQSALGVVYFAAVSYAAPQAQAAFMRAYELCERVHEVELKGPVLYGIGAFQTMKGDMRAGHGAFEKLIGEARSAQQPRLMLYAHSALTWSNYNRGQYATAIEHARETRTLYEAGPYPGARLSAADPKVIGECFRAASLWSLGFVDQARAASESLVRHARESTESYSLAYTLNFAGLLVPDLRAEYALVLERVDEGFQLARDLGYPFMEVFGTLWKAWAIGQCGDTAEALAIFDEAMEKCRALGVQYHSGQLLARRARLLLTSGQTDNAQACALEALAYVARSGERSIEADAYQAQGEIFRAGGRALEPHAEAYYLKAIEAARNQFARSWELRAATALASLWGEQGHREKARELLAPVYEWFTEGKDTADLKQAAALLSELE